MLLIGAGGREAGLDDYGSMALLNTEFGILQSAKSSLGPGQTCAVMEQTIQSNVYLIRMIL